MSPSTSDAEQPTPTPFVEEVATQAWLEQARTWIGDRLAEHGLTVDGEIEQTRVRPWSTQLVAPTADGPAWFKAGCPSMAFEPALHLALAELAPAEVDRPLGTDPERGWILTRDRGQTLAATRPPTTVDWARVVRDSARLQRRLREHRERLLTTGLPDRPPASAPERFDALLAGLRSLPPTHPSYLTGREEQAFAGRRDRVVEAAAAITEAGLPLSLQHGDLHPNNVLIVDDDLRVFDFGDALWGCALEVLRVPQAMIEEQPEVVADTVLEAYVEGWEGDLDLADVRRLWDDVSIVWAVGRAETWFGAVRDAPRASLADWGVAARHHLGWALGLE
ncbi:hypothetical protein GCM10027055_01430 [Janibacter alkaliphilus]|uniref:Aminoglycoside phosphotransferase domain-containing protein n=1 Tax=Janibacter alkaliphilus TaxID=1069963 RepID=A0A852X2U3_9MICO|nr:phosphotransferase [Janibacter alkaliphilus]NYG36758.1 hypothetical protein [Janibacter alkaliphilus]